MKNWDDFKNDGAKYSPTEEIGLKLLKPEHKRILSVGISTAGFAEVRMALEDLTRKVTATTLDEKGILFSKNLVKKYSLEDQIELKIEDISDDLDYQKPLFDFVYARLVLHYLPNNKLEKALQNIYSLLKNEGGFFIVVRSYDWESEVMGAMYDLETGLTTYPKYDENNQVIKTSTRRLHSVGSISSALKNAGFSINSIELVSETIFGGYERVTEKKNDQPANLIVLHARK